MTANGQRHNLSDWLSLHELEPSLCREILTALAGQADGVSATQEPTSGAHAYDVDVAWLSVVEAMCSFFPMQRALISEAFARSTKIRVERHKTGKRALTLVRPDDDYPTIVYNYDGTASDVMIVAHEFAHAVQIVASEGRFVAPIIREVCAFFGEMALLCRLQNDDEAGYLELQQVWRADTKKYILSNGNALVKILSNRSAPYRYYWNYPIARYIAVESANKYSRERIWMLFEGHLSVRQVLKECWS